MFDTVWAPLNLNNPGYAPSIARQEESTEYWKWIAQWAVSKNFEREVPDNLWAMMLRKLEILQTMYGIISALATKSLFIYFWVITVSGFS